MNELTHRGALACTVDRERAYSNTNLRRRKEMNFMRRLTGNKVVLGFVVASALVVAAKTARADLVTYGYVGSPFTGTSGPGVTGTLTLDNTGMTPRSDGSYYYPDGSRITAATLTSTVVGVSLTLSSPYDANATAWAWPSPTVTVDLNGQIIGWYLQLFDYSDMSVSANIVTNSGYNGYYYDDAAKVVNGNWVQGGSSYPGTWTLVSSSPVPLPPSVLLLAPGLLGLVVVRRRFKK
jgi:hypothetical protein